MRAAIRATLAAATLLAATTPAAGAADAAGDAPPLSCAGSARVLVKPGLTTTAQDFTFDLTGAFPCQTLDGAAETATIAARGTGNGSCFTTTTTVPFTVTWADGSTSRGQSEAVTAGPVATMTGGILDGRFEGTVVQANLLLVPSDVFQCGLSGVTGAAAYGEITFTPGPRPPSMIKLQLWSPCGSSTPPLLRFDHGRGGWNARSAAPSARSRACVGLTVRQSSTCHSPQ